MILSLTHITTCCDTTSTSTDHLVRCQDTPPVILRADIVANNWQKTLLQDVSQRAVSCEKEMPGSGQIQDQVSLLYFTTFQN